MKRILVLGLMFLTVNLYARNPFTGEGGSGTATEVSTLETQTSGTSVSNSVEILNFDSDFTLSESPTGKVNISINDTNFATSYVSASSATATYENMNRSINYSVCISTPYALGSVASLISPFRDFANTISSITVTCIGGTNVIAMIEQRAVGSYSSAGTDIWSGDVTALTTGWIGGTSADFTIPANYGLFLVITSVSGNVDRLLIKYTIARD